MAHSTLQLSIPTRDCLLCGSRPMSEDANKRILPMVCALGMDVNFGEPFELCQSCVSVMADLLGRVNADEHDKLVQEHTALVKAHEELETKYNAQKDRISKMIEGKRAEKAQLQEA